MIKAITFDCWDTILDDDVTRTEERKKFFQHVFKENGFPLDDNEFNRLFKEEGKIFQNYIIENRKTPNSSMRVDTIARLADVDISDSEKNKIAQYSDNIALQFRPPLVPLITEVLEQLSSKYTLAVICNTGWHSGKIVRQLLEGYNLPGYFSHLTFSDEAGIAKPHKQIFEYTLEKIGFDTRDSVHIGDSEYSDIVGAKEAGMKAILFTGINDKYKHNNTADIVVNDYNDFAGIIDKL
jgi:putative hydrolase of the HAD superfamily